MRCTQGLSIKGGVYFRSCLHWHVYINGCTCNLRGVNIKGCSNDDEDDDNMVSIIGTEYHRGFL